MSLTRAVSALAAIAVALTMIVLGGWFFSLGFLIIVILGELEFFALAKAKNIEPAAKTTVVLSVILLLSATFTPQLTDALFPLAGGIVCFYLLFKPKLATIADISTSILGLFYGGCLPTYWVRLRVGLMPDSVQVASIDFQNLSFGHGWPDALKITFLAFACIWAADIGAYVMGKAFGKTPLSTISPKKTVEGAVFGTLGSMAVGGYGAWALGWPIWPVSGLALGLIIGLVSLMGDLTESLWKRDAGVKDSGQLIPGHGGILDRTDSYVFTGPFVFYYVTLGLPMMEKLALNWI
ncbi:MAG: phosphatidate cytidylyltransferase [Cyanobacteria bacterium P01_H01_bin.15]